MDFGGHMRCTYNGSPLVVRAKLTIEPTDEAIDIIVNQNGSVSSSGKPKAFRWSATFEDTTDFKATGFDWNTWIKGSPYNISFPEDETGVVHTFTGCKPFGTPKVDRDTGEVTGIEGAASIYTKLGT